MQLLIALVGVLTLTLAGCQVSNQIDVGIAILEDDASLEVSIVNRSGDKIVLHDQLFDRSGGSPVLINIQDGSGKNLERCRSVDYFPMPREIVVGAGNAGRLQVPISLVSFAHCLQRGDIYRIRVGVTDVSGRTHYSDWTGFRSDGSEGGLRRKRE